MHLGENDSTVIRVMGTNSASRPTEIFAVIKTKCFNFHSMQVQLGSFRSLTRDPCAAKQKGDTKIGGVSLHPFPKRNQESLTDRRPGLWWPLRPHQHLLHWRRLLQLSTLAGLRRLCGSLPEPPQQQLLRRGLCRHHLRRHKHK